jgi:integrase
MLLNNFDCKNAKPRNKKYRLFDGGGLYLEITPNGQRYWRLKYRIYEKEKRIALGIYPNVSLAEAREKREEQKKLIKDGFDPAFIRDEKKRLVAFQAEQTFELVTREWYKIWSGQWSKRYASDKLYRLERNIFPEIGHIPITKLKAPDVVACLRKIEDRSAHDMAKRALQTIAQVMRYAVQTGRIERSFVPDLRGALIGRKSTPFAAITPDEIPELLKAIEASNEKLFRQTTLCIKLMMLTFVRTRELTEAPWNEFNFEKAEWVIPAERMKMRKAHVVPLSRQALEILNELKTISGKRTYVFPHISNPRKTMSNNTILTALKFMGYKGRMTGHGFRALAMTTIKEKLDYRHEIIDRQLAHLPKSSVDRAYDRAQFLPERREMMQKWADYLDGLSHNVTKEVKWKYATSVMHKYATILGYNNSANVNGYHFS